ncbi:unnamed protein product [Effrenium voratum]|uniref:Glycosyl transferase family 25 domain-containing protein n=1 Tax=Effrenium voratum TaxID=2562239 RepID=A0AA36JQQ5_9DINO|nr:unnamed protein product [Effrenium voratum]
MIGQALRRDSQVLRCFLRALAKASQGCHSAAYAKLASELQLVGLAHGNAALAARAEEAAETLQSADLPTAADLFWAYLTAKAPEIAFLEALEQLALPISEPQGMQLRDMQNAVAALLCGLAQPQISAVFSTPRLLKLADRWACCLGGAALPTQTLPRLALALSELLQLQLRSLEQIDVTNIATALFTVTTAQKQHSTLEDLADFAVALALAKRLNDAALWEIQEEVGRRLDGARAEPRASPGCLVQLRQAVGRVPAGSRGLLGEFHMVSGRWRFWPEVQSLDAVDVWEEELLLLDGGKRPARCCQNCWQLAELFSSGTHPGLCKSCASDGIACASELVPLSGIEDLPDGFSARSSARLAVALALQSLSGSQVVRPDLIERLRLAAADLRHRSLDLWPFEGPAALSPPSARARIAQSAPAVPVLVVNLDRSPHRLQDMRREVQRCGLRARRCAATDGRHRVVRRSRCAEYTSDLPSFSLRWDEARPALGLALTASEQRHFVGYVGSWLSHMRAVRQGIEEGAPFVVVLEDDQVLSPDFNAVLDDIISCAGDLLDVVVLGPLDWRLRSLQYAQPRKVMQLRQPCVAGASTEEEYMAKVYGYKPGSQPEGTYFLYSIGSRAMAGEDVLSTGCCGVWGYLVSRRGCQKMEASMKFMWESFDDVLQAEMQGDNRFTRMVGKHRLWAVWPPLVTSDGKWPSQNSGEDLDFGRQCVPVSPHAGFRDHTLQTEVAHLVLGPAFGSRRLRVAAASALLWPKVEPVWAYVVCSWRRLFHHRAGTGGGFELRTEIQHKLYKERRFFDITTEGLTWSWTVLRAAFLLGLAEPVPCFLPSLPPEGPPIQLPPLTLRILHGPLELLAWCPEAWFRDLLDAAPGTRIELGTVPVTPWRAADELRRQLPGLHLQDLSLDRQSNPGGAALAFAAFADGEASDAAAAEALKAQLALEVPALVTGALRTLLELWRELSAWRAGLQLAFLGRNPFAAAPKSASSSPATAKSGRWARLQGLASKPALNGAEVLIVEEVCEKARWQVRLEDASEIQVRAECLDVFPETPWPPVPEPGLTLEEAEAAETSEEFEPGSNQFWMGVKPAD